MALAAAGSPKRGLLNVGLIAGFETGFSVVFQLVKTTWFSRFVESTRRSRLYRSFNRKVRASEARKISNAPRHAGPRQRGAA